MKHEIQKALSKLKYIGANRGLESERVNVIEIPSSWEFFPGSKDVWQKVEFPEDVNLTGCVYKAQAKSIFKGHYHDNSDEIITVVNPEGSLHVYTPEWDKLVQFNESITIPRGIPHVVVFNEATTTNIVWHPAMDGWKGDFLK